MESLKDNQKNNLKAGFEKCGTFPLNKDKLLDRLPENQLVEKVLIGDSFLKQLEQKRLSISQVQKTQKKKKKMQVAPGKSITAQDVELALADVNSKKKSPSKTKRKRNRSVSSSSEDDTMTVLESDGVSETFSGGGLK